MPKNKVSDPITDQEIAFARLVLSGAMTDRHAAEAVGLNPDSAAYTKSKPSVRAYMLSFPDIAEIDVKWDAFRADPDWKKLSAQPRYSSESIVSDISNLILRPASFSQI